MTSSTWEMGMAYPMPSTSVDDTLAVLMPISFPFHIEQAAAVAGIDGCVSLDIGCGAAVRTDGSIQGADDAGGH